MTQAWAPGELTKTALKGSQNGGGWSQDVLYDLYVIDGLFWCFLGGVGVLFGRGLGWIARLRQHFRPKG